MSIEVAQLRLLISVKEVFSLTSLRTGEFTVNHEAASTEEAGINLDADTTPSADMVFARQFTGAETLDLTALVREVGGNLDATDRTLVAMVVNNLDDTNDVTVAPAAENGFDFAGPANEVVVAPHGRFVIYQAAGGPAVGVASKDIDVTAAVAGDWQILLLFSTT